MSFTPTVLAEQAVLTGAHLNGNLDLVATASGDVGAGDCTARAAILNASRKYAWARAYVPVQGFGGDDHQYRDLPITGKVVAAYFVNAAGAGATVKLVKNGVVSATFTATMAGRHRITGTGAAGESWAAEDDVYLTASDGPLGSLVAAYAEIKVPLLL